MKSGDCRADAIIEWVEGDYRLEYFSVANLKGAYSFDLFFEPPAQNFSITVGATPTIIADSDPAVGAGNIETVASRDQYDFSIASAGKSIMIDNHLCPSTIYDGMGWRILNRTTNAVIKSSDCRTSEIVPLDVGEYRIEYFSVGDRTGPYSFAVFYEPEPDQLNVTLSEAPFAIFEDSPGSGAGNIETIASRDRYIFSVPAGGKTLNVDNKMCPGNISGSARWRLLDAGNTVVKDLSFRSNWSSANLAEGQYVLEYYSSARHVGNYSVDLSFGP